MARPCVGAQAEGSGAVTYMAVDDGFYDHPKVAALFDGPCPGDAVALWTLAGSWVSRHTIQEGVVPRARVRLFGLHRKSAGELVRVGLWHEVEQGYIFHDWTDINPSREAVINRREKTAKRVKAHRQKRMGNASCNGVTGGVSTPDRTLLVHVPPTPTPSDPNGSERYALHGSALDRARSLLRTGYTDRYRRETRDAWMGAAKAHEHIGACAAWVADAGEDRIEARAAAILDGMFADPWMREHRWPWGAVANDPAKYGSASAPGAPPLDPDRAELARLDAALNAARTQGDHDEVDRVRAEQRAFLDRVQRRTA